MLGLTSSIVSLVTISLVHHHWQGAMTRQSRLTEVLSHGKLLEPAAEEACSATTKLELQCLSGFFFSFLLT